MTFIYDKYSRLKIGGDIKANIYLPRYAATSRKHFDIIEKNLNILKGYTNLVNWTY